MQTQPWLPGKRSRRLCAKLLGGNKFCLLHMTLLLLGWGGVAVAQGLSSPLGTGSAPALGGVNERPPAQVPILNGTQNARVKLHLGPTGKPCLTVQGYAKPQIVNPNIFTHMIIASNDCSQSIKMKVCYYQSQQCIPLTVPEYGRNEVVLGIMPAMTQFRFEYQEQFNQGIGGLGVGFN